jgi:hypothetical protein
MRLPKFIPTIIVPILVLIGSGPTDACASGLLTHDEVAQRTVEEIDGEAYPDLLSLLQNYPDERDGGSVFPDWGYAILNDALSLIAHSADFREAYESYVEMYFPPPYTAAEERQIAFLAGVVDHQTSDDRFHPYFLVEAMEEDGRNEQMIELGIDIFTVWEHGQMNETDEWYVPARTIRRVYSLLGYPGVTGAMIVEGMVVLRAGMHAEQQAGFLSYLLLRGLLPWTHENYMTYTPGGIEDQAAASAWENQVTWDSIHGMYTLPALRQPPPHPERSAVVEMGRKLLKEGRISVPVEYLDDGSVLIGVPEVRGTAAENSR